MRQKPVVSKEEQLHEQTYSKIIEFYDLAEELVKTVESDKIIDPVEQLDFVEPLVKDVEEATDIIAEEYRNFVQTGKKPGIFARKRIEKALESIYTILQKCKKVQATRN
jgi:hypothetical protein